MLRLWEKGLMMSSDLKLFEIVKTSMGVTSIRNNVVNEIMHVPMGPWQEANELYIEQSNLKAKLSEKNLEEFVIYDVGLGAAANALAAIHCARGSHRPLRIVSFEIDLRLLEFALAHSHEFEHFQGYERAIECILKDHHWGKDNIIWKLFEGDFLRCIDEVQDKCHLIFYDPYSAKQNQEMWTTDCFKKLRGQCHEDAIFYNYSQATPIRAALLEAGFYVGYGIAIGEKESTTQATCQLKDLVKPLDDRWFQRWLRSGTPFPPLCKDQKALKKIITEHEQFCGLKI